MNELNRIPGAGIVQGVSGQGAARDGKPRLERRRRKKKKTPEEEAEAGAEEEKAAEDPGVAKVGEPEDDSRGHHVDVRA